MPQSPDQVLTAAQMRDAEAALIAGGISVDELMQRAGRGAAEWVWRMSGGRPVTVLCGPGNNGGDGYVIAEAIRERGGSVQVVAASDSKTAASRAARGLFQGQVLGRDADSHGEVLVDCLFGTGLTRPLHIDDHALLNRLAARHPRRVAVDLPSGVHADNGMTFNDGLPSWHLTLALGAWKPAHFLLPAAPTMGELRLVPIGVRGLPEAGRLIGRPRLAAPAADAHKYKRGLLGVVTGAMPGASLLAARAAQGAGAGYVKVLGAAEGAPPDLVVECQPLAEVLTDSRYAALLVGPGLGRDAAAREILAIALSEPTPAVVDADGLILLSAHNLAERQAPVIATPHEGELFALERAFGLDGSGSKLERAEALARATGMVVVAKGADTLIAAPDGRVAFAPRATSWLSTAGTGDVLAGAIASQLANGADPFAAACEGVWLHGEAARLTLAPFTAGELAAQVARAYAACL
ncbi:NAD(P)H-hydrate dehydratase [Novosphingobium ginsenosidimutans]|uniref:Bifunctional NAD(P)H-hydrate repair enzyme n=1 Tax=Novosphingobium ginsenosidimutans TaxID=1176536 RepID=A0A5B8RZS8_9SPHN|nr:NAD(P)H-hydrate dehydratase [Novosphingobium ginsenosidimutans]QEA14703.1 NAD(P)H-hydrate dehydratase [Novosphingobium ginsenosidimutans]